MPLEVSAGAATAVSTFRATQAPTTTQERDDTATFYAKPSDEEDKTQGNGEGKGEGKDPADSDISAVSAVEGTQEVNYGPTSPIDALSSPLDNAILYGSIGGAILLLIGCGLGACCFFCANSCGRKKSTEDLKHPSATNSYSSGHDSP